MSFFGGFSIVRADLWNLQYVVTQLNCEALLELASSWA